MLESSCSVAVDNMFLVTTCKEGAGNGLLWLLGMCHILQMCSLHVRILLVKLKTLHSAWFILGHHFFHSFIYFHSMDPYRITKSIWMWK